MMSAEEVYEQLVTAVAIERGVAVSQARLLVNQALHERRGQHLAAVAERIEQANTRREALPDVPWETIRSQVKLPPEVQRQGWERHLAYWREHAHEVWEQTSGPDRWRWYVLKSWSKDRSKPYARAFCLVDGFESELGDVYWSDITAHARRVK